MPSDQDGIWAMVGSHGLMEAEKRGSQTQPESSPTAAAARLVRFLPWAAVYQAALHPIWPQLSELWIPPFALGHDVPA